MIVKEVSDSDKQAFNHLATHPLQSWEWGEFRKKTGIEIVRLGRYDGKKLVETAQITIHPIPFTSWTIGYFPKGILPGQEMMEALQETGKEHRCIFIKMEPNVKRINQSTNQLINQSTNIREKYGIKDDFILFVGTLQPRKNIIRLVEAYEKIKMKNEKIKKLQLVIVGKRGWMWEETVGRIENSPFRKDIIIADFVSDDDLPDLYRSARCFVLPSLYEGFGIPAVEAMACGCPVVVSNVSSLPEIVGDAAILIDPNGTADAADAILEAGYNEKRRNVLIKKGLENVKRFLWETCAQKTLEALLIVAKG